MDMPGNEKESENPINYDISPGMTSQWQQLRESNLINTSIGMIQMPNSMVESFSCSAPLVFDHSITAQNPSCVTNDVSASTSHDLMKPNMIWAQQNAMFRGSNVLLPTVPRMIPPSLPHFPADLGFIERAARFSCFSGGNFGDVSLKTFNGSSNIPYSQGLGMMQGPCDVFGVNGSKPLSANQSQRRETIRTEAMLSPLNDEKKTEAGDVNDDFVGNNMSDEAEISGRKGQEESNFEFSGKGSGCKKRKRPEQDMENKEHNELTGNAAPEPSTETANNNTKGSKHGGKNIKEGSLGSDQQPKEGYIHVRARRGQATNSHSLAERVRREKISERMKFLQDLVPGCSKVTGKAVMLDEIINYVQSLQRQVEFLSMKLATVNPRLDFNIEGLLAKDILQPRGGGLSSSSSLPFPMNRPLPFPPFHPSLHGQVQAGLMSLCNNTSPSSNVQQLTQSCGGFKEPMSSSQANMHMPNMWDDELHNVVEMGFDSSAYPLNSQGLNGSLPEGQMKTEP